MKVNFVIRTPKMRSDGLVPIELSICIKGKRRFLSTGRKVKPSCFNSKQQTVKGDKELNKYLSALKSRIYSIETYLLNQHINISIDTVLDIYRNGEGKKTITFLQLFDIHISQLEKKAETKVITESTISKYRITKEYSIRYIKEELKKDDILIDEITPGFIDNLFVYLLKYMSNNTAIQKMKQVKKILRIGVEEGYIKVSPFKISLKKEKKEVKPLTMKEVNIIKNKKIDIERLSRIRDLYIFESFSGLAFTDLMSLEQSDFVTDEDGNKWIIKKRHKTSVISTIPILPIAQEILDKYNYNLPKISNVKYNAYLKELGDICGIKKSLHSHLARHFYATMLLNHGMDMVSVSKCLGHSNSKITESTYAKVLPETISKKIKEIEEKLKEEGLSHAKEMG